jgi:hypothetical protein
MSPSLRVCKHARGRLRLLIEPRTPNATNSLYCCKVTNPQLTLDRIIRAVERIVIKKTKENREEEDIKGEEVTKRNQ